jgi:hypothetical protein
VPLLSRKSLQNIALKGHEIIGLPGATTFSRTSPGTKFWCMGFLAKTLKITFSICPWERTLFLSKLCVPCITGIDKNPAIILISGTADTMPFKKL